MANTVSFKRLILRAVLRHVNPMVISPGFGMLKRQQEGATMSDPVRLEAGIQMLAEACPDQPPASWDLLRTAMEEGFQSNGSC